MSLQGRRSSLLNIENWLDKCSNEEPDSLIYDPDYCNEVAQLRTKQREPELEKLYGLVADTCTRIGLPPNIVEERLGEVDDCLSAFLNTIQKDVQEEFDKLCQYKQELLDQIQKMLSDLYLPAYVSDENLTLLQHCKRLKTKFNELNVVKEKRMTRLQELRDKQTKHCLVLGIKTPQIRTQTDIPTEEELIKLANTVMDLEKEEKQRKDKYNLLRDLISKCMDELELEPESESILTEKPNYTESYLLKLSELHARLEVQYSKAQEKFEKLKSRLESLFERLDVPQDERDRFFEAYPDCKPSMMVEMEVEIERYEELKRQNIGKFIEKIKEELVVEYERCYVSQDQQDSFFSLSTVSGECNEQLLELYERELERIKRYYKDNQEMLEKFQKWRLMWKELIDLEVKANDPNRFNNRGGQLLLEERKRKTLQKGLPKVEKELEALNEKYMKESGEKFKIFDTQIDEFISGCWDELNNAKEEEKRERQRAKMTTDNKGRRPLQPQVIVKRTPAKRAAGAGITPTPSKLQCRETPKNNTYRSNQMGMSGSVKKCQSSQSSNNNMTARERQNSNGRSNIPVSSIYHVNQREKMVSNSNGSETSALSLSEQEFEEIIITCPASAKRAR